MASKIRHHMHNSIPHRRTEPGFSLSVLKDDSRYAVARTLDDPEEALWQVSPRLLRMHLDANDGLIDTEQLMEMFQLEGMQIGESPLPVRSDYSLLVRPGEKILEYGSPSKMSDPPFSLFEGFRRHFEYDVRRQGRIRKPSGIQGKT